MNVIAVERLMVVPDEYIETQAALPFDLFDGHGRLLLPANRPLSALGSRVRSGPS